MLFRRSATIVTLVLSLFCILIPAADVSSAPTKHQDSVDRILGYINSLPPETPQERAKRHAKVAERRTRTPIMVHRGANQIAPENTLEAYAAAMDYGADGCEIDLRKTRDGVIYLLHDDTLDRMMKCSGKVRDKTYYELLQCSFKNPFGSANNKTRIPTFISFLALAKQRAMLIHLDVKESEIQGEVARIFDQADMWDHIVEVNGNTPELRNHPKVKLIPYKPGDHVVRDRKHIDHAAIRSLISSGPGLIFCDDPRVAAEALGRSHTSDTPVPGSLKAWWTPQGVVDQK